MKHRMVTHAECIAAAQAVAQQVEAHNTTVGDDYLRRIYRCYGVPRGGVPASYLVAAQTYGEVVDDPDKADYFVDDIEDSGATRRRYTEQYNKPFFTLFKRTEEFLVFPWEASITGAGEDIPTRLLQFIGEDPNRDGLKETPARFLAAWTEYTSGYHEDPADVFKTFVNGGGTHYDELVLVRDIPVYSHCEHHLAPFFGVAHVAYIPTDRVLGLSKFARLVEIFARRLQIQERLTQQVAFAISENLSPKGVGVVLECRHMCMEGRGARAPATTTTSCLMGALREDAAARAEFMRLVR